MVLSDLMWFFNQGKIEQSGSPIEIYTKPETHFAASFIGNYNILDSDEFHKLVGIETSVEKKIGIRPETIQILREPMNTQDGEYLLQGRIKGNSPRGNVLRYQIDVKGIRLYADVLFRSFTLFENETNVYLTIPKRDCLELL